MVDLYLRFYEGQEAIDPRINGKHEHYTSEYNRLSLLLEDQFLSIKERKIIEREIERAMQLSLESVF